MVLWKDSRTSEWFGAGDYCTHRKGRLSQGRIESDGSLSCGLHGWRFDGNGELISNPQEAVLGKYAKVACVKPYKVSLSDDGILWAGDPNFILETQDQDNVVLTDWVTLDLPYGMQVTAENLVDISHTNHVHDGILGDRKVSIDVESVESKKTPDGGFECVCKFDQSTPAPSPLKSVEFLFDPPHRIRIRNHLPGDLGYVEITSLLAPISSHRSPPCSSRY